MAEGKRSFVLYCDLIHTVKKMPKEKAGELLLTILQYVNDENPVVSDQIVDLVFEPIKQQLKRDLKEWESRRKTKSEAGKMGGVKSAESRSKVKQEQADSSKPKQSQANQAVTATATVTGNVNGTVLEEESLEVAEIGSEKVSEIANEVWKDQKWREQTCMGLSIKTPEFKKWLALFNSSISSDRIPNFDKGRYMKMSRGWIAKQQSKGITVEAGVEKKSNSAPLTQVNGS